MAQKRMFDKAIIDTDRFMDLSMTAKALYFLLGMDADDEGFVSARKVQRVHGGNEDDVKILIAKNFLIPFKSGVVVITDWNNNNWLDSRRIKPTKYQEEKKLLALNKDGTYMLSNRLASAQPEECSIEDNRVLGETKVSHVKPISSSSLSFEDYLEDEGYSEVTFYGGESLGECTGYKKSGGQPRLAEKVREEYERKKNRTNKTDESKPYLKVFKSFIAIDPIQNGWRVNKTQINAANGLFEAYGMDKIDNAIDFYIKNKDDPFIPRIFSPHQLLEKYTALQDFRNRKKGEAKNMASEITL